MKSLQPSRSHVLLTLGTLFAFGGASRFVPNGFAAAEETELPPSASLAQAATPSENVLPDPSPTPEPAPPSDASEEVCLTGEAADKLSQDLWLFETERTDLRQREIELATWEAELNAQTAEIRDLQTAIQLQWDEMQQQAGDDIVHLASMYGSMRAEQAAGIFNQMDPDFAAGFLMELPSEQAGMILANMEKTKAYVVSVSMASINADVRTD